MKNYFLTVDTETTQSDQVADFAAVITDSKGQIMAQCAVMVNGIFTDEINHHLFFDSKLDSDALWSKQGADKRYMVYNTMLKEGSRMLASVAGINSWLAKANKQFSPILTAYNLPFDLGKCANTGIDLTIFDRRFDLMAVAQNMFVKDKKFLTFVLENHLFNNPTKLGNMTFQMKAETVANFLSGMVQAEPHTALEDIIDFELPILRAVLKKYSVRKLLSLEFSSVSWQNRQVKDYFKVK